MSFREQIPRRLAKLLRDGTSLSRNALHEAVVAGRVRVEVDGRQVPAELDQWIFGDDRVELDGAVVRPRTQHTTVLYHKPAEVTATLADTWGRADLSGPLAAMPAGCFPVGRLDRATTGAMLFTNDGDLAHAVLSPAHRVAKVYRLDIAEALTTADPRLSQLVTGVPTALGCLKAEAVRVGRCRAGRPVSGGPPDRGETELWLTLRAGKNRQIRRMCQRTGLRLLHLHRQSVGSLELGDLAQGEWRLLNDGEVDQLWRAANGREHVQNLQRAALVRQARAARDRGEPIPRLEAWLRLAET